jgi:hypothetical protein
MEGKTTFGKAKMLTEKNDNMHPGFESWLAGIVERNKEPLDTDEVLIRTIKNGPDTGYKALTVLTRNGEPTNAETLLLILGEL